MVDLRELGRGGQGLRLAYGRIFHEANAFSPLVTEPAAFEAFHHFSGSELATKAGLRGAEIKGFMPQAELSGFVQACNAAGGVTPVPLTSSLAVPSGPLTRACFQWLLDSLLSALRAAGGLDGVYLALHGSMEVLGLDEAPEAVIIREVRAIVGDAAKVAVSLDLHANLSDGLVDPVDVLIGFRTNPHWDLFPTGWRAGNRLIRTIRGQVSPVHAWRKLPLILGGGMGIDFLPPMNKVFRWMKRLEKNKAVLSASLFMVHPFTTADNLGWSAHICTDGDPALANRLAEELADRAWAQRAVKFPPMRQVAEALDEAKASPWRRTGPITMVDVDDIVGAGAPGGNTRFVQELVRDDRGLKALVPVHDPAALELLWDRGVGETVSFTLRGTEGYDQPAVPVVGAVGAKADADFGRVVRVDVGSFHLAVCAGSPLPIHPRFWRQLGLKPRQCDVIVQKNFFHYRIFYATTSFRHIPVVSAGASSLQSVRERQYAVPVYPQVDPADWRALGARMKAAPRRATD